jgi:16S rRNA (uracil1498-N3)-methyltransferase
MHQVYVRQTAPVGERCVLEGEERHYLGRALRARAGERFRLAAEDGSAVVAVLEGFDGDAALLRVEAADPDPVETPEVRLDLCPPKGDALDEALEMAVQLGVERIRLVRSERTLAEAGSGALKPERLERRLREAARQCLRARVPILEGLRPLRENLEQEGTEARCLMSERGGAPLAAPIGGVPVRILVGPEGGFTAAEIGETTAAGWVAVSLGPRPLRTPTAVAAALAGLRALARARGPRD